MNYYGLFCTFRFRDETCIFLKKAESIEVIYKHLDFLSAIRHAQYLIWVLKMRATDGQIRR